MLGEDLALAEARRHDFLRAIASPTAVRLVEQDFDRLGVLTQPAHVLFGKDAQAKIGPRWVPFEFQLERNERGDQPNQERVAYVRPDFKQSTQLAVAIARHVAGHLPKGIPLEVLDRTGIGWAVKARHATQQVVDIDFTLHQQPGLAGRVQFLGNGLAERGGRIAELVEALTAEDGVERFFAGAAEAGADYIGREEDLQGQPSTIHRAGALAPTQHGRRPSGQPGRKGRSQVQLRGQNQRGPPPQYGH